VGFSEPRPGGALARGYVGRGRNPLRTLTRGLCSEHGHLSICSSMILVIHDNMINGTNLIVDNAFEDISRSHGCNNNQS
jgi:hypothetical protein